MLKHHSEGHLDIQVDILFPSHSAFLLTHKDDNISYFIDLIAIFFVARLLQSTLFISSQIIDNDQKC